MYLLFFFISIYEVIFLLNLYNLSFIMTTLENIHRTATELELIMA